MLYLKKGFTIQCNVQKISWEDKAKMHENKNAPLQKLSPIQ